MNLAGAAAFINGDETQLLTDLQAVLSIDTSLPPGGGYQALNTQVEKQVAPLGFVCEEILVPEALWHSQALGFAGPRANMIASRRRGRPPLSIYFHTDTVPPGPGWTEPPFAATRRGERIYGRGAADMKGTIAATVCALRAMKACDVPMAYDPILLCCTDEEGGTYPGIRYLAEQHLIEGPVICLNGSAEARIWAGCFGSVDFHVTVTGRSGHSGNPGQTINAIEEALPLLNALVALKSKVEARASAMPAPPYLNGAPLHARLTLAVLRAGHKTSSVPGDFVLQVNRRYGPEENFDGVVAEFEATVGSAMATSAARNRQVNVAAHLPPVTDPDGPSGPRWQAAMGFGFGYAADDFVRYGASSSSDMGWVQQYDPREILLGGLARKDNNTHGADEWTTVSDLKSLARTLLAYLSEEFEPAMRAGN